MIASFRFSSRVRAALLACAAGTAAIGATPAFAQDAAAAGPIDGRKVLELLVAKGLISQEEANVIIAQSTAQPAAPPPPVGGVAGNVQTIPYVPEPVLARIREQVRAELTNQAQVEGWARPGEIPDWTRRITLSGDVRVRGEGIFFSAGNSPDIPNFAGINAGAPFNINRQSVGGQLNPPFLNTREDRNRARLRARLGIAAELTPSISAEVRVATGNDSSPVTTNQTLGGGNGDFSKYSVWLDAANIRLHPGGWAQGTELVAGRFDNPFSTTDILFDEDLSFDGVAITSAEGLGGDSELSLVAGAFPVYNTDLNFGSRDVGAFRSRDRWLLAAQLGLDLAVSGDAGIELAAGLFEFTNAAGRVSSPCTFGQDVCDTDNTRPLFQQYGNSVFPIRDNLLDPNPGTGPELSADPQYFGLASPFRVLQARAGLRFNVADGLPVSVDGEYLNNLRFDRARVIALQTNVVGNYDPSGVAWHARLRVGPESPGKWGEWSIFGGYKRIGSDATIDAFNDSDFHLGGTNARGYYLGGAVGLGGNTSLRVRYLSADEITGQPYAVDVLHVDLNAKF